MMPNIYTASQFALACDIDARTIRQALGNVPADGTVQLSGNEARAWRLCSLPIKWQQRLETAAERKGFRNVEQLLSAPVAEPVEEIAPAPSPVPPPDMFFEIRQAVGGGELSEAEQLRVLRLSIEKYDALKELGESQRIIKREILGLLWKCQPKIAPNRNALRVFFDRKYSRYLSKGQKPSILPLALRDGRIEENKSREIPLPEDDVEITTSHTVIGCGQKVSQGWREVIEWRWLTEATLSRYLANPSRKSHVPRKVREAVRYEVEMMASDHRGRRQTRDNGAFISRYWGLVNAMDWYGMDDATLPVYYYVPDGKGWYALMRGQFLLCIDNRSTCILGFALMPERNYNARVIRSLITRVCDEYGLPRKGFHFERGIWENSKILKGDGEVPIEWAEAETGLLEFGLRFYHSIRARSKPIERVIGALQNFMEADPGYAGRCEMLEKFEEFQQAKLNVESRKLDPRKRFYSLEQWQSRLGQICLRYNSDPREGKMTLGLSPADAMEKFRAKDDPRIRFDPRCRYLFANHRRPIRVTTNGITLKFGNQVYNYRNQRTGELRGRTVLAWFDPDVPQVLAVTDMDRENVFCVERSQDVPAIDAPEELLSQELQRIEAHMSYSRTRYQVLKAKYDQNYRPNLLTRGIVEIGEQIDGGRAAALALQAEKKSLQTKAARAYEAAGIPMPNVAKIRPEQIEGAERLGKIFAEGE